LCRALDLDKPDLESKLSKAGYGYDPSVNQFR